MPNSKTGDTSVFRTSGLNEIEIWSLAQKYGPNLPSGRRIHGCGDIHVAEVRSEGLRVEPDVSTHLRHANILGWSTEILRQRVIAIKLAQKAILHLIGTTGD